MPMNPTDGRWFVDHSGQIVDLDSLRPDQYQIEQQDTYVEICIGGFDSEGPGFRVDDAYVLHSANEVKPGRSASREQILGSLSNEWTSVRDLAAAMGTSVKKMSLLSALEREGLIEVLHPSGGYRNGERRVRLAC